MLPQGLCALWVIVLGIKYRKGYGDVLLRLFLALLYPLLVPAYSICASGILLLAAVLGGENEKADYMLTDIKFMKMFEHLGQ